MIKTNKLSFPFKMLQKNKKKNTLKNEHHKGNKIIKSENKKRIKLINKTK